MGKEVSIVSAGSEEDMDQFEEGCRVSMLNVWAQDMRLMFDVHGLGMIQFDVHGLGMIEEEHETQVEFLGKKPESYERFVQETAKQWLAEGGGLIWPGRKCMVGRKTSGDGEQWLAEEGADIDDVDGEGIHGQNGTV